MQWFDPGYPMSHCHDDILANDWEVEEDVFKFTESEFKEALNESYRRLCSQYISDTFDIFPEELQLLIDKTLMVFRENRKESE